MSVLAGKDSEEALTKVIEVGDHVKVSGDRRIATLLIRKKVKKMIAVGTTGKSRHDNQVVGASFSVHPEKVPHGR
ncbi:MAG: hypothetical protein QXI12_03860 [Candidatus Methanomethyliaceae archaeon]